jgi:hypothetical protein
MRQGILYLQNNQQPNRTNTAITSYKSGKPNYSLSNFYRGNNNQGFQFIDPDMGKIWLPTAEHYLHFQKLTPKAKNANYNQWKKATAGQILSSQRKMDPNNFRYGNGNKAWSDWDKDKIAIQQQINLTKFQQSWKFRQSINLAIKAGKSLDNQGALQIIEDTSSNSNNKVENNWGTGPMGEGTNILGNTQTAFANAIAQGHVDIHTNPSLSDSNPSTLDSLYNQAVNNYKNNFQPTLKTIRQKAGSKNQLSETDTADLGPSFVNELIYQNGQLQSQHQHSVKKKETAFERFSKGIEKTYNVNAPIQYKVEQSTYDGQDNIILTFRNKQERDSFLSQIPNGAQSYNYVGSNQASLGKTRIAEIAIKVNTPTHGISGSHPMFDSLVHDYKQPKRPSPKPSNNNSKTFFQWLEKEYGVTAIAPRPHAQKKYDGIPGCILHIPDSQKKYSLQSSGLGTVKYDHVHQKKGLFVTSDTMDTLHQQYLQDNKQRLMQKDINQIDQQLDSLEKVSDLLKIEVKPSKRYKIKKPTMQDRLQAICLLASDWSNNNFLKNASGLNPNDYDATGSFAHAIKIYAELHRDSISQQDYQKLIDYSHKLAHFYIDNNGEKWMDASLKTDSNFIAELEKKQDNNQNIDNAIEDNAQLLLHGGKPYSHKQKTHYKYHRFLPDNNNHSETDEIFLQTGGMNRHYALSKIVKKPVDIDGNDVKDANQAHHFDYYWVDYNAGGGTTNFNGKTCNIMTSYKIQPYQQDNNGWWSPANVDVKQDPQGYQDAMEDTIGQIIISERHCTMTSNEDQVNRQHTAISSLLKYSGNKNNPDHSTIGYAQTKGNCTVASQLCAMRDAIGDDLTSHFRATLQGLASSDKNTFNTNLENRLAQRKNALNQQKQSAQQHAINIPNHQGNLVIENCPTMGCQKAYLINNNNNTPNTVLYINNNGVPYAYGTQQGNWQAQSLKNNMNDDVNKIIDALMTLHNQQDFVSLQKQPSNKKSDNTNGNISNNFKKRFKNIASEKNIENLKTIKNIVDLNNRDSWRQQENNYLPSIVKKVHDIIGHKDIDTLSSREQNQLIKKIKDIAKSQQNKSRSSFAVVFLGKPKERSKLTQDFTAELEKLGPNSNFTGILNDLTQHQKTKSISVCL